MLNVKLLLLHVDLLVPVPPARAGRVALTQRAFEAMSLRAWGMTGLQPGPLGRPLAGWRGPCPAWSPQKSGQPAQAALARSGRPASAHAGAKNPARRPGSWLPRKLLRSGLVNHGLAPDPDCSPVGRQCGQAVAGSVVRQARTARGLSITPGCPRARALSAVLR